MAGKVENTERKSDPEFRQRDEEEDDMTRASHVCRVILLSANLLLLGLILKSSFKNSPMGLCSACKQMQFMQLKLILNSTLNQNIYVLQSNFNSINYAIILAQTNNKLNLEFVQVLGLFS